MATLTTDDFTWCIDWIRNSQYKDTLKQSGLTKTQVTDGIQAIETYSVGSYTVTPTTTLRTAIETATSATPTTAQNQAIWYAWSAWKAHSNEQGA